MKMAWGLLSSVRLHTDRIGESEVPQPSRFFPQIIGSPIRGEGAEIGRRSSDKVGLWPDSNRLRSVSRRLIWIKC